MIKIVPIYASLLALIYIALAIRTIRLRRSEKVGLGFGSSAVLERAMRVHGNFAEYVPLTLILFTFLELQQFSVWILHGGLIMIVAGRCLHAYGVSKTQEDFRFRIAAMASTFTVIGLAALLLLYKNLLG